MNFKNEYIDKEIDLNAKAIEKVENIKKEQELLGEVCEIYGVDPETINRLIRVEMSMIGKRKRRGLQTQIDTIIQASLMTKDEEGVGVVIKESNI
jgi:hypothetical protein